MYLFFDTETTGLPKNWKAPVEDVDNWPRLVQIGWVLTDDEGGRIEAQDFIIKPEGFSISSAASNVHRITTEKALAEGHDLKEILNQFNTLINETDFIVAHNIAFDEKIIGAEFLRNDIPTEFWNKKQFCTMKSSTNYCKIPGPYGFKWPKLSELHIKLFGEDFEGAHDAMADINATSDCFWEMRKRQLI